MYWYIQVHALIYYAWYSTLSFLDVSVYIYIYTSTYSSILVMKCTQRHVHLKSLWQIYMAVYTSSFWYGNVSQIWSFLQLPASWAAVADAGWQQLAAGAAIAGKAALVTAYSSMGCTSEASARAPWAPLVSCEGFVPWPYCNRWLMATSQCPCSTWEINLPTSMLSQHHSICQAWAFAELRSRVHQELVHLRVQKDAERHYQWWGRDWM